MSGTGLSEIQRRRLIELSRFFPFENGWREATFAKWSDSDKQNLVRLLRKFVDDLSGQPNGHRAGWPPWPALERRKENRKPFIPNDLSTNASRPVGHRLQPFDKIGKRDLN